MPINEHLLRFAGYPVVDWDGTARPASIYRLSVEWGETDWEEKFFSFLDSPVSAKATGLVVGLWGEASDGSDAAVEMLVNAADRLPELDTLFIADVTADECEISWIMHGDITPLFHAFPGLKHFGIRGASGLSLGRIKSDELRTFVIQSGALDAAVVRSITQCQLPRLKHLELWLGSSNYGANCTVQDIAPIITTNIFPQLRYLGLRNAEISDEIAELFAASTFLENLTTLDLSLGTISDKGANALLNSPRVNKLHKLDLHHHFLSEKTMNGLRELRPKVDVSDPEGDYDDDDDDDDDDAQFHGRRYVSVSE